VGAKLPDEARNTLTRTFRLNQAKAENVATILASQGAEFNLLFQEEPIIEVAKTTISATTGDITTEAPKVTARTAPTLRSIKPDKVEGSDSSFILKGLLVSIDDRLNSVTLVGEARQVEVATSLILQMDARRRQVSINVKVVDINLTDSQRQSIDFNFGDGGNYGYNQLNNTLFQSTVLNFGNGVGIGRLLPNPTNFSATIEYAIASGNAKVLTDPTLVVQEGQFANVAIVQKVLAGSKTSYQTTGDGAGAITIPIVEPTFEFVGLTLGINVEGIDDNGFISMVVKPTISAPSGTVEFNSGAGGPPNTFTLVTKREVQSGLIRLRDSQTLILSGIITQQDRSEVTKVPILGDIPILGVLFRSQNDRTERSEVVVILTPKIVYDDNQSQFGSNYTPSRTTSDLLKENNFPAQVTP
jgi:type IV pilus assembly protein PilQ